MYTGSNQIFYIIGAGSAGVSLCLDIKSKFPNSMVVFLDDDVSKAGTTVENIPVLAPIESAIKMLNPHPNTEVIIAMPSSPKYVVRKIYLLLKQYNFVKIRILPSPLSSLAKPHFVQTQEININDLLSRETIMPPDKDSLANLKGKRVLITGAGGSIGSELAIQLLYAGVSRLYLLGHGEYSIYNIRKTLLSLQQRGVGEYAHCIPILCELIDSEMVQHSLSKLSVDVIFHTAAFKHIDMVEENAGISLAVNVFGTKHILKYAQKTGVKHFVFLSTDKAVNPISIYGASKLISEELVMSFASDSMTVSIMRFGNVIGSRGSVVPLFQEQIAMGGPLTITSPECKRYFMSLSEACSLTLSALQLSREKKCNQYVLEMGEQLSMLELAKQTLEFYGLKAEKDIKLSFIGLRPGEKLEENLIATGESRRTSPIDHIYFLEREPKYNNIIDLPKLLDKLHVACFYNKNMADNYFNHQYIIDVLHAHMSSLQLKRV